MSAAANKCLYSRAKIHIQIENTGFKNYIKPNVRIHNCGLRYITDDIYYYVFKSEFKIKIRFIIEDDVIVNITN